LANLSDDFGTFPLATAHISRSEIGYSTGAGNHAILSIMTVALWQHSGEHAFAQVPARKPPMIRFRTRRNFCALRGTLSMPLTSCRSNGAGAEFHGSGVASGYSAEETFR